MLGAVAAAVIKRGHEKDKWHWDQRNTVCYLKVARESLTTAKAFLRGGREPSSRRGKRKREWETAVDLRVRTLTGAELLRRMEQNTRLEK